MLDVFGLHWLNKCAFDICEFVQFFLMLGVSCVNGLSLSHRHDWGIEFVLKKVAWSNSASPGELWVRLS